jgi:hypothetical protein
LAKEPPIELQPVSQILRFTIDIAILHVRNIFEEAKIAKYCGKFAAIPADVPIVHGYAI